MPSLFSRSSSGSLPLVSRSSSGSTVALCCSDGTAVAHRIRWAATPWRRMRGLLADPEPVDGEAFILCRTAQVHSVGLGYDIDVVFCDKSGVVLRVMAPLRRNRVSPWIPGAHYAIELRAGAAAAISPGSVLCLRPPGSLDEELIRASRAPDQVCTFRRVERD